jgi:hypothetical protein
LIKRLLMVGITVLLAFGWNSNATAVTIVSPGANTSVEGNGNNIFPFDIGPPAFESQRYEQVYGARDFGSSPLLITGLAFRPDAQFGEQRQYFSNDYDKCARRAQRRLRKQ